jgi:peptide/nickel transport system substrate-binding protein
MISRSAQIVSHCPFLRLAVRWHDGRPFTANDVGCTWDLILDKGPEKLRQNVLKSWFKNLEHVTTNGEYEVTFQLKRPQPALLSLLASKWSLPGGRFRPRFLQLSSQ